jgi:hypothetical protein
MNGFFKKQSVRSTGAGIVLFLFIATSIFSPLSAVVNTPVKTASAQVGAVPILNTTIPELIMATGQNAKEGFAGISLDTLAWQIAKQMIQQMTSSLVDWINSGFNGNPAFISDPLSFFQNIGDEVLGGFLESTALGFICSPFRISIQQNLAQNYYGGYQRQVSCTLSGAIDNLENFFDNPISFGGGAGGGGGNSYYYDSLNFSRGGLYDQYTQPQNNPLLVDHATKIQFLIALETAQGTFETELNWGEGFLSWRDCSGVPPPERGAGDAGCPISTPGSVIEEQLNHTLGLGGDTLVTADEINEIIGALLNQLMSQLFGGGGLFGLSAGGNSNYGGGSYSGALSGDTSGLTSSKELSNAGIDQNIRLVNEYIRIKNQTLTKINTSIGLQQSVINQCGANADAAAQDIITNTLQPLASTTQAAIDTSRSHITKLEEYRTRFNALPPGNPQALSTLQTEYLQYLSSINIDFLIQMATFERDFTIPQQLDPLDTAARQRANQCRQQNNNNSNNNPPFGGNPNSGGSSGEGGGD